MEVLGVLGALGGRTSLSFDDTLPFGSHKAEGASSAGAAATLVRHCPKLGRYPSAAICWKTVRFDLDSKQGGREAGRLAGAAAERDGTTEDGTEGRVEYDSVWSKVARSNSPHELAAIPSLVLGGVGTGRGGTRVEAETARERRVSLRRIGETNRIGLAVGVSV